MFKVYLGFFARRSSASSGEGALNQCSVVTYLLEKSRVCRQAAGESAFHALQYAVAFGGEAVYAQGCSLDNVKHCQVNETDPEVEGAMIQAAAEVVAEVAVVAVAEAEVVTGVVVVVAVAVEDHLKA